MSQIQNLGNGNGWIYAALPDGSNTIVCVEKNTRQGVHNMRQIGTTTAPIVANRSAVGTIQVTAVPVLGDITTVTINGVNQIGANVPVTIGQVNQTATDLAGAINAFTPTGYSFTAEAIADIVYVYSAPQEGALVNGLSITISVTNVAITTTTTAFSGGSNQDGVYDSTFGYQFYLDSSPSATASTINLSTAEDASVYFVTRGLQTGIFTESLSVNASAQLLNITRCSAFTNILTDTNSMNPASDLTYIDPNGFVQGDVVRLTQFDSSRVVTIVDVSQAQQFPANIYLTNADPFNCQDNKSVELRLQYDPVLGSIWIENSRSFVAGPNIVTRAEMLTLISNNQVKIGENYLVTNAAPFTVGIDGIIITGISSNAVSTSGQALFYLPDYNGVVPSSNFNGTWNQFILSVTIGGYYAWNNALYESLTGLVGTDPNTDTTNWAFVPITDPAYAKEVHTVQYNLSANNIVKREDKRGNTVTGTAALSFRFGDDDVTNNVVQGGFIDPNTKGLFNNNFLVNTTLNFNGIAKFEFNSNIIYSTIFSFSNINNPSTILSNFEIKNNNFTNCQIAINNSNLNPTYTSVTEIVGNTFLNGRFKITNGIGASAPIAVANNTYTGSFGSSLSQFNVTVNAGGSSPVAVTGNIINSSRTIAIICNPSLITPTTFSQNTLANIWANTVNFTLSSSTVIGCSFSTLTTSTVVNYTLTNKTLRNEVINTAYSTYVLELFAPSFISGTTLTLPIEAIAAGTIRLTGTGSYTINKIDFPPSSEYPRQPIKITGGLGVAITIVPTLAAAAGIGSILSDGGTVSFTGFSFYVIQVEIDPFSSNPYWIKQYNTEIQ